MVSKYLLRNRRERNRVLSKQRIIDNEMANCVAGARMAGDERRLQILRIAVRLFSQQGFRGTTTKEIAQNAGISEAMVFRHFANKVELYSAILDHKACAGGGIKDPGELIGGAINNKDDRAVFETLAFEALQHHDQDPEFQRLLLHSALEEHELAQMFWERTVLQIYDLLGSYIGDRQRDGAFRRDVNPRVVVRAFVGMIIHHSLNNNLWDKERRLLNITNEQAAREFTEILLRGITVDRPNAEGGRPKRSVSAKATKRKK